MTKRMQARLRELVRNFKENGIKFLLQHPENVRELLQVALARWARKIDFSTVELVNKSFIRRDFRHVEADVVLTARLKSSSGKRSGKKVVIYI